MKKEIETNERIESYLNGDLSKSELEDFLKLLDQDPALNHEVGMHRQIRELIADGASVHIKNELKNIHLEKIKRSGKIRRITGFGAAGLIVVLSVLWITHTRSEPESIKPPVDSLAGISSDTSLARPAEEQRAASGSGNGNPTESPATNEAKPENKITGEAYSRSFNPGSNNSTVSVARADTVNQVTGSSPEMRGNNVSQPAVDKTAETRGPFNNCRKIKFSVEIIASESCNNSATGSFKIRRETASGGIPPYAFSLSKSAFNDSLEFTSMYAGNYPVYIKDGNNCIGIAGIARIGSIDCNYQAVFAPMKGETWPVPAMAGNEGVLRIISKTGTLVYKINLSGYDNPEWNGEATDGQQLPMGIYQFEIRYRDGTSFEGNVTIVR